MKNLYSDNRPLLTYLIFLLKIPFNKRSTKTFIAIISLQLLHTQMVDGFCGTPQAIEDYLNNRTEVLISIYQTPEDETVIAGGNGVKINVNNDGGFQLPESFGISSIYPNPFNSVTTLQVDLPEDSYTKIAIYDINGRLVKTLFDSELSAGQHRIFWEADRDPSGIYFVRFTAGKYSEVSKLVLLK